jgi:cystathionine beta-lyase
VAVARALVLEPEVLLADRSGPAATIARLTRRAAPSFNGWFARFAIREPQVMFDFDRVIERRGTHASKWDNMARLSGIEAPDAIPMWVADMDFAAPPGVTEALAAETGRAVHGYYADTGSWAAALADWMARRHGLRVDPAWVSPTPGIVSGLGLILQAVSAPGDEVVVFPPTYHAFRGSFSPTSGACSMRSWSGRWPLRHGSRSAARQLTPRTKVVFLCSPQSGWDRLVARIARWPPSAPSTT